MGVMMPALQSLLRRRVISIISLFVYWLFSHLVRIFFIGLCIYLLDLLVFVIAFFSLVPLEVVMLLYFIDDLRCFVHNLVCFLIYTSFDIFRCCTQSL